MIGDFHCYGITLRLLCSDNDLTLELKEKLIVFSCKNCMTPWRIGAGCTI